MSINKNRLKTAICPSSLLDVNLSTICCVLGLIYVYKIGSISYAFQGFGVVWSVIAILELVLAFIVYLRGGTRIGKFHWRVLSYCSIIFISTVCNNSSLLVCLKEIFALLPILVAADLGMSEGSPKLLRFVTGFAVVLTTINTLSAVLFPNAMFRDVTGAPTIFFLGADNSTIPLYMIAALLEMCSRKKRDAKDFPLPYYSLINLLLFSVLRDIATGKLMAVILLVLLVANKMVKPFCFSLSMAVGLNVLFFVVFVLGQANVESASFLFDVLGRSSTFTHRSILWAFSLGLWVKSPLLGIGSFDADGFNYLVKTLTTTGLYNTGNPHNSFLTVLLTGGIIAFAFVLSVIPLARSKRGYSSSLYIFLFAFLLHAQVEGRDIVYIFFILLFIMHMNGIANRIKEGVVQERRLAVDSSYDQDKNGLHRQCLK